jgi:predicted NAD/FAD-binding protein
MPDLNEMLQISANKVAQIIVRSRETGAKAGAWDDDADPDATDVDAETDLEEPAGDPARLELREFLAALNADEQASLIALAWIGRGTYAPGELAEAISTAKAEHGANALEYLFSLPLLPDYLEDASEQLGISAGTAEEEILRPAGL